MSDKAKLKRCKKDAELARNALDILKQGQRFYNSFDWGHRLAGILLSMEKRLRDIESYLDAISVEVNRYAISNATVQITTTQTINSDAEVS